VNGEVIPKLTNTAEYSHCLQYMGGPILSLSGCNCDKIDIDLENTINGYYIISYEDGEFCHKATLSTDGQIDLTKVKLPSNFSFAVYPNDVTNLPGTCDTKVMLSKNNVFGGVYQSLVDASTLTDTITGFKVYFNDNTEKDPLPVTVVIPTTVVSKVKVNVIAPGKTYAEHNINSTYTSMYDKVPNSVSIGADVNGDYIDFGT